MKLLEKDFKTSIDYAEKVLTINSVAKQQSDKETEAVIEDKTSIVSGKPECVDALLLKGEALFYSKRYDEAIKVYTPAVNSESHRIQALLGIGKSLLKKNQPERAKTYFEKAYKLMPRNVDALFYYEGLEEVSSSGFIEKILEEKKSNPFDLMRCAELYASQGFNVHAVTVYSEILKHDSLFFPAQIGLAQILAADHQYDSSLALLRKLAVDFPDNYKVLFWQARVLGWSKRYQESINLYETIKKMNLADPVPQKEQARTAMWGNMIEKSMQTYSKMLTPSVDSQLLSAISAVLEKEISDTSYFQNIIEVFQTNSNQDSPFSGYEFLANGSGEFTASLSSILKRKMDSVLVEFLPLYRIQKAMYLESQAKWQTRNNRYVKARILYEELIQFSPGNEEACFDYAQVGYMLNLYRSTEKTYMQLLDIDPLHNLASLSLKRTRLLMHPFITFDHWYWNEEGRGGLAQITRNRTNVTLEIPVYRRFNFRFSGNRWFETPKFRKDEYIANGTTFEFNGFFTPYLKGEAGLTYKKYYSDIFKIRNSGYGHIWLTVRDYVQLGAGYDKTDEIYNYFGIKHGTQADSWWGALKSQITRKFDINGQGWHVRYNDHNTGQRYLLSGGYAVS
ncbi:MAG: tetratricopeptide repeat protein, partial [Patescibacteria group bacterium]|nr:tetratricopeptide repeat protein [Patescibacteria group bacterium]